MNRYSILMLNTLLRQRQDKNPLYSVSALARDLSISQSQLSRILMGKRRLPASSALKLGLLLKLESEQLLEFLITIINEK